MQSHIYWTDRNKQTEFYIYPAKFANDLVRCLQQIILFIPFLHFGVSPSDDVTRGQPAPPPPTLDATEYRHILQMKIVITYLYSVFSRDVSSRTTQNDDQPELNGQTEGQTARQRERQIIGCLVGCPILSFYLYLNQNKYKRRKKFTDQRIGLRCFSCLLFFFHNQTHNERRTQTATDTTTHRDVQRRRRDRDMLGN